VPRSAALTAFAGDDRAARLAAVTAGDDYALICAAPPQAADTISEIGAIRVGRFDAGAGLSVHDRDGDVPLPDRLGYEHAHR
jgi:thiamine-monophosphate kinase